MHKTTSLLFVAFLFVVLNCSAQLPGSLDQSWGGGGIIYTNVANHNTWAEDIAEQTDGKIVIAGGLEYGEYKFTAIRYTPFGMLDTTFGNGGIVITDFGNPGGSARALIIQPDGNIVVCGHYVSGPSLDSIGGFNTDFAIIRIRPNGDLDSTFGINGRVCSDFGTDQDMANAVAIQTDGKIIISGEIGDGSLKNFITVRYHANGIIDSTFGSNGIVTTAFFGINECLAATIQTDGKIVVAGNGSHILRYDIDGILDTNFGSGGSVSLLMDGGSKKVVVQPDQKIVYAGYINGTMSDDLKLTRVNEDGTIDNLFGTNGSVISEITIYNDWWRAHDIQNDGRIVVAGMAIPDSGIFHFSTARFNTNGTIDTTYGDDGKVFTDVGKSDAIVHSMTIQTDGKIIVAGSVILDNMTQVAIVRYNGGTVTDVDDVTRMTEKIKVVPNPSDGLIHIAGGADFDQIELYSTIGELVYSTSDKNSKLDVGFLPPGIYLMKIIKDQTLIKSEKIVLQ